ncbi:MAG: hypothetical protein KGM98_00675, partial [Bacteroidota bacterium]|nr:hypothetical protein [Bacteroidota bacterium]
LLFMMVGKNSNRFEGDKWAGFHFPEAAKSPPKKRSINFNHPFLNKLSGKFDLDLGNHRY